MEGRDEAPRARLKALRCRRTNAMVPLVEHERCPYCFGRMSVIEKGSYEAFCDYDPAKDPIHLGFPLDGERLRSG